MRCVTCLMGCALKVSGWSRRVVVGCNHRTRTGSVACRRFFGDFKGSQQLSVKVATKLTESAHAMALWYEGEHVHETAKIEKADGSDSYMT